ncbi:MAG: hypothetical protein IJP17_08255 [Clostridia bacterium]|nr:hypothetical protein [Clostridia bacterium]
MKRYAIKAVVLLLAAAMMLCICSCGKEDTNEFTSSGAPGQTQGDGVVTEQTGAGFSHSHAVAAGFGLGSDKLSDISSRFGAPASSTTDEYTSLTLISASYPFGVFEFESTDGSEPVLTFAEITSDIIGPCGVTIGMDMKDAAELIYTGGGDIVASSQEQKVYFYGGDGSLPFGSFAVLTIEFTSSETDDFYALEYCAQAYDESKVTKFEMFFDEAGKLLRYTLRYS